MGKMEQSAIVVAESTPRKGGLIHFAAKAVASESVSEISASTFENHFQISLGDEEIAVMPMLLLTCSVADWEEILAI
jgi:hypothetical protein